MTSLREVALDRYNLWIDRAEIQLEKAENLVNDIQNKIAQLKRERKEVYERQPGCGPTP